MATIGPTGDHLDIMARMASLGSLSGNITDTVQKAGISVSATQNIGAYTSNGFRYTLSVAAGDSFADAANGAPGNALYYNEALGAFVKRTGGTGDCIEVSADGPVTIERLQIGKFTNYARCINQTSSNDLVVDQVILHHANGGTASNPIVRMRVGTLSRGIGVSLQSRDGVFCDNGTVNVRDFGFINLDTPDTTVGITRFNGTVTVTNCWFVGYNTDGAGTLAGSNNATSKAAGTSTLPATGLQTDLVAATEFEGATTDFRIKLSTSVKLLNNGTGASPDIFGQSNSGTKDIGPFEAQSGGGAGRVLWPPNLSAFLNLANPKAGFLE